MLRKKVRKKESIMYTYIKQNCTIFRCGREGGPLRAEKQVRITSASGEEFFLLFLRPLRELSPNDSNVHTQKHTYIYME